MILWTSCRRSQHMLDSFLGIHSQTETGSKPQHVRSPFRWYLAARCSQVWDLCVWSCSRGDTGYQILEQKTVVKLNDKHLEDTSEWGGFTEKEKIKHWTYQHRWVMRALHSLSNRSSFQVCSASGSHTNAWFDALPLLELKIVHIQDEKLKSNQVHLFFFLLANKNH